MEDNTPIHTAKIIKDWLDSIEYKGDGIATL